MIVILVKKNLNYAFSVYFIEGQFIRLERGL